MLRKGITILLMHGKKSQQTVCCNQITRVLSSRSGKNTSCLDSAHKQHDADYSTVKYQIVHPGKVSSKCFVPDHIQRPSYALGITLSRFAHNLWPSSKFTVEIKSKEQIRGMRDACRLARNVLNKAGEAIQCGVTTDEIDVIAHNACIAAGAYPSPLFYRGFPKSICTSVNNVACHGIPDDRPLCDGDIVNVDVTVYFHGFHGDVSETFLVGNVDIMGRHLVDVAKYCRDSGIAVCGPGQPISIIGKTIRGCVNPVLVTSTGRTNVDIGVSADLELVDNLCYYSDMLSVDGDAVAAMEANI